MKKFQKISSRTLFLQLIIISGLAIWLGACSTEKNTMLTRAYHNLTAHYNVYFNGKESLKKGVRTINENHVDKYTNILSVFQYGDERAAQSATGNMDKAIEKASKLIKKHSITARPKRRRKGLFRKRNKDFYQKEEYNLWVDDAYMLMGKAHFYKMEYHEAVRAFEYVIQKFQDPEMTAEARLWIARSHIEKGDFKSAIIALDQLRAGSDIPNDLLPEFHLLVADYYMKQENYNLALPNLHEAIELLNGFWNKKKRARYQFIIAQIYQKQGKTDEAFTAFNKVIDLNPDYELAFNAKISMAELYDGAGGSEEIKRLLYKMLKDEKNYDYQDQIYYALANIEFAEGDIQSAKELYKRSSATSVGNTNQKAISCLALADIYFSEPNYELAQAYYDSTILNLDPGFPNYQSIYLKTENLSDLVMNIKTVQREDSLQRIAQMPENKRLQFIDNLIQQVIAEEARAKQAMQGHRRDPFFDDVNNNSSSNRSFPFYNPSSLSRHATLFRQKWGNRKLEDNWRRSNKAIVENPNMDETETAQAEEGDRITDKKSREYYLQDLPENDSLMAVSHQKIIQALLNMGEIYAEKLNDYNEAIKVYEDLNKRYPQAEELLSSYYNLYKLNEEINNKDQAEHYKELIIDKFPNSMHAKLFTNPNYLRELEKKQKKLEQIYTQTYTDFKNKNYKQVITASNNAEETYPESTLIPKFKYLKALSIGAINAPDVTAFKKALKDLVFEYPDSEVKPSAENIIRFLEKAPDAAEYEDKGATEIYNPNLEPTHFYVIILNKKDIDINRLKFNITKYNVTTYDRLEFNVSAVELTSEQQMITVKSLPSIKQAIDYFNDISKNKDVFSTLKKDDYEHFIISAENFTTFFKDKNIETYLKFFNKNYSIP